MQPSKRGTTTNQPEEVSIHAVDILVQRQLSCLEKVGTAQDEIEAFAPRNRCTERHAVRRVAGKEQSVKAINIQTFRSFSSNERLFSCLTPFPARMTSEKFVSYTTKLSSHMIQAV